MIIKKIILNDVPEALANFKYHKKMPIKFLTGARFLVEKLFKDGRKIDKKHTL